MLYLNVYIYEFAVAVQANRPPGAAKHQRTFAEVSGVGIHFHFVPSRIRKKDKRKKNVVLFIPRSLLWTHL